MAPPIQAPIFGTRPRISESFSYTRSAPGYGRSTTSRDGCRYPVQLTLSERRIYRWAPAGKLANSFSSAMASAPSAGMGPVVTCPLSNHVAMHNATQVKGLGKRRLSLISSQGKWLCRFRCQFEQASCFAILAVLNSDIRAVRTLFDYGCDCPSPMIGLDGPFSIEINTMWISASPPSAPIKASPCHWGKALPE